MSEPRYIAINGTPLCESSEWTDAIKAFSETMAYAPERLDPFERMAVSVACCARSEPEISMATRIVRFVMPKATVEVWTGNQHARWFNDVERGIIEP